MQNISQYPCQILLPKNIKSGTNLALAQDNKYYALMSSKALLG